ncbi:MAG: flavodoxin-dependent (E)-4-hydroxy-3-methylbut-2-enyl-diphosphate synthase, partial [Pirellulales bacterium]
MPQLTRNPTRCVAIGSIEIGAGRPVAVQSMTATKTHDVEATSAQIDALVRAGADIVRVAVDSVRDADALARIRE